ncbi:MAG: hypothetical protein HOP32_03690 [Nitrospira sp.]|nr:hypothetical protein [Nitrospira sp.]
MKIGDIDGSSLHPFGLNLTRWLPLLVLVGGLTGGCAFGDLTIQMPQPGTTTGYSGGKERALIVPVFVNRRAEQRIGMKKNGYNMDTADALPSQDVNTWLGSRLGNELRSTGFRVNPQGDNPNATTIQGFTHQLFIEPVMQWFTVDIESDISVLIRVSRPDGLEAERRYFVKGLEEALIGNLEDDYAASLRKASNDLMRRVVADVMNLLNRFPETPVRP